MPAPDALESLLNNPGTQCTLFPFLGQLGDAPVACWDLWYNTLFVHDVNTQDESGAYGEGSKWDKVPGIDPYIFGYVGLALAISISVSGAAWCAPQSPAVGIASRSAAAPGTCMRWARSGGVRDIGGARLINVVGPFVSAGASGRRARA